MSVAGKYLRNNRFNGVGVCTYKRSWDQMQYEAPSRDEAKAIMANISVGDKVRYLSDGAVEEVVEVTGSGAGTHAVVMTNGTSHHVSVPDLTSSAYGDATVEVLGDS